MGHERARREGRGARGSWLALSAALAAAACGPDATTDAAPTRPDVVLVVVADLSDWVGCLGGHAAARTPAIDALARRGVLFANAHAQAPLCNPSRTSFFLGLRPTTTGVYGSAPWFRDVPALAEHRTLPEHFARNGYRTLAVGKVFHASATDDASFEEHGPAPGQTSPKDERVVTGRKWGMWDFGPQTYDESELVDVQVVDWAVERLADDDPRPLFLAVGIHRPHVPLYAPPRLFEHFADAAPAPGFDGDDLADVPAIALAAARDASAPPDAWFRRDGRDLAATRAYLAATELADEQIGRLVAAVDASPRAASTVLVLLSDHGFHLGEKSVWGKRTLWERSTRVPLVVVAPGARRGAASRRAVELVSLFPTLLDLCGLEPPPGAAFDAPSLAPLLADPDAEWEHVALTSLDAASHSVRDERWRFTRWSDGSEELYDHRTDPHEQTNLADAPEQVDVRRRLARALPARAAPDASVE